MLGGVNRILCGRFGSRPDFWQNSATSATIIFIFTNNGFYGKAAGTALTENMGMQTQAWLVITREGASKRLKELRRCGA